MTGRDIAGGVQDAVGDGLDDGEPGLEWESPCIGLSLGIGPSFGWAAGCQVPSAWVQPAVRDIAPRLSRTRRDITTDDGAGSP
jgi:hypothetical protein